MLNFLIGIGAAVGLIVGGIVIYGLHTWRRRWRIATEGFNFTPVHDIAMKELLRRTAWPAIRAEEHIQLIFNLTGMYVGRKSSEHWRECISKNRFDAEWREFAEFSAKVCAPNGMMPPGQGWRQ
ncbi:MAG: hypothetical protein HEQ23_03335 [Tepidisphaera sp.]